MLPPHFPSYYIASPLPEAHVPIHPGCRETTATHNGTFAYEGTDLAHRQLSPLKSLRIADDESDDEYDENDADDADDENQLVDQFLAGGDQDLQHFDAGPMAASSPGPQAAHAIVPMVASSPGPQAFPIVPMATLDSACGESLKALGDRVWIDWDFVAMDKILAAIKSKGPLGLNRYLSKEFPGDNSYQDVIEFVGMDILDLWEVSSTHVCKHTFSSGD